MRFIKNFGRGGIKWIKSETYYFYNIERREFSEQIVDRGTSQEYIVSKRKFLILVTNINYL